MCYPYTQPYTIRSSESFGCAFEKGVMVLVERLPHGNEPIFT